MHRFITDRIGNLKCQKHVSKSFLSPAAMTEHHPQAPQQSCPELHSDQTVSCTNDSFFLWFQLKTPFAIYSLLTCTTDVEMLFCNYLFQDFYNLWSNCSWLWLAMWSCLRWVVTLIQCGKVYVCTALKLGTVNWTSGGAAWQVDVTQEFHSAELLRTDLVFME